jgi:L-aminopeptidase/D-esterase-like protein
MSGGIKGGLGSASVVLETGITVAALVAVNSLGFDHRSGQGHLLGSPSGNRKGICGKCSPSGCAAGDAHRASRAKNTTLAVVATDAVLTKSQAKKIAMMAHDGMARAIRPAHTMFDGDIVFCLATGKRPLPETPGFFAAPAAQAINEWVMPLPIAWPGPSSGGFSMPKAVMA